MLINLARQIMKRPPDFIIGGERPYIHRWYVIPRNRWFNIYLHDIRRSDDDRALHDHPWVNCSIILEGCYWEVVPQSNSFKFGECVAALHRRAGSIIFRRAVSPHRLVLPGNEQSCITLFITGPKIREWGFYGPRGWVPWQQFTDPDDPGKYRESNS